MKYNLPTFCFHIISKIPGKATLFLAILLLFAMKPAPMDIQVDSNGIFREEIRKNEFTHVRKHALPVAALSKMGLLQAGGNHVKCDCSSRHNQRINWAVKGGKEIYVMEVETCGRFNQLNYYIYAEESAYEVTFIKKANGFQSFKTQYVGN